MCSIKAGGRLVISVLTQTQIHFLRVIFYPAVLSLLLRDQVFVIKLFPAFCICPMLGRKVKRALRPLYREG
jgi:hypothetical protein